MADFASSNSDHRALGVRSSCPFAPLHLNGYGKCAFSAPCLFCNACICPLFIFYFRKMQEELRQEKEKKAALIEREKLARELHDGIAQSLFLLSVKMNKFGRKIN